MPALDAGIFFFEASQKMAGSSPALMRNWELVTLPANSA
jgi:hypothetical protein